MEQKGGIFTGHHWLCCWPWKCLEISILVLQKRRRYMSKYFIIIIYLRCHISHKYCIVKSCIVKSCIGRAIINMELLNLKQSADN